MAKRVIESFLGKSNHMSVDRSDHGQTESLARCVLWFVKLAGNL
jgi:hypothetical protein